MSNYAPPTCPRCGSPHVTAGERGFKVGTALGAAFFIAPIVGVLAGAAGRKNLVLACMTCGHRWEPSLQSATPPQAPTPAQRWSGPQSGPSATPPQPPRSSGSAVGVGLKLGGVLVAIIGIGAVVALNSTPVVQAPPSVQPVSKAIPEVDVSALPTAKKTVMAPAPKPVAKTVDAGMSLEDYIRQEVEAGR